MLEKLDRVINKLSLSPSDFIDIRYAYAMGESFTVRNGRFDSVSNQTTGGISARALIDNAWGFTTIVKTDEDSILQAAEKAIKIASIGSKYTKQERRISDEWVFEGKGATKILIDPREIDKELKFEKVILTEKSAREYSSKIAQASSTYQESHGQEIVVNNRGTRVENETHVIRLMKNVVGREGTKMQNVFDSIGGAGGWELVEKWEPEEEGLEAAKQSEKLLKARDPPAGNMNVIMDPSLTGVFIHEAFGHACEADGVIAKNSILEGKINEKVGVEQISVYDDPTLPGLRGSFEYDSEGTKARKRTLVEKGVLKEYFHTLETAAALNMEPNGSGRAMNFNVTPQSRMGNTYVDSGDMKLEELAENTKEGVYLRNSYGGYVFPAKGQFYFTCQLGYYIENGEITDLMGNVGMSGMTLEVLKNTFGVGEKWVPDFLGTCGKGGQWVPVTGGGPNLGVSNVVVGGTK
ncbi:MAG: TldD/PmbA family protein [Candidatus Heimdallarchaeota archaeon]|nr:TldD/PmbA family protein [Candidatus Heimdallarchaeota archaeon]MCK4954142.1 TldD/PmbA family protein [Candidatus Heimdallarchaeota archaeon]